MRKCIITILTVLSMIVIPLTAGAVPVTYTDTTLFYAGGTDAPEDYVGHGWGDVNKLDWTDDYVRWKHQFVLAPPAAEISSGALSVYLFDDEADQQTIKSTMEFGTGITESGKSGTGEIDTGVYSFNINVDYLTDGIFEVRLASDWGDFFIKRSELDITYEPVPEPATIMLLGAGILGIAASRKKFANR